MLSGVVSGDIRTLIESNNRQSSTSQRQQSETSIQKQLVAFERLLQHSMSRFSKETLYNALRHVTEWAESQERKGTKKGGPSSSTVLFKLRSINQLREIVNKMKISIKPVTSDYENIFKKCELFMNDILYLKDLKKYFDDEIHKELIKYHFDPLVGNETSPKPNVKQKQTFITDDEDSGNGSQPDTDDVKKGSRKADAKRRKMKTVDGEDIKKSEARYKNTIRELSEILRKWEGLLSEYTLDLNDFDPDSYHELMQFSNYSQFEPILRMVPDIFAKCYKCIDLAKLWLKDSNIVMPIEEIREEPPPPEVPAPEEDEASTEVSEKNRKEFVRQVRDLQSQIENVDQTIAEDEMELVKLNREMSDLADRERRYSLVSSGVERIDSDIEAVAGEYQKTKTEQYAIASKLRGVRKGSTDYDELKSHLKRLDSAVAEKHWKLKLLEFERTTVQSDFLVELDVRPTLIRYEGATQERIDNLERVLNARKEEKIKLTKQMALLKTNTERMRNIMRSYLGNSETPLPPDESLSRDSTIASSLASHSDDLSEFAVDGNEADDDDVSTMNGASSRIETDQNVSTILKKPTLVKHGRSPILERKLISKTEAKKTDRRDSPQSRTTPFRGPKAALRSTPRRVWEDA